MSSCSIFIFDSNCFLEIQNLLFIMNYNPKKYSNIPPKLCDFHTYFKYFSKFEIILVQCILVDFLKKKSNFSDTNFHQGCLYAFCKNNLPGHS